MPFSVSTFDVCAPGFERLRSYSEVILTAPIGPTTTAADLLSDWFADIQACMRPDGFDFDGARDAVQAYCAEHVAPLFAARANPFNLEPGRDDIGFADECCEGVTAYLFLHDNAPDASYPVWG